MTSFVKIFFLISVLCISLYAKNATDKQHLDNCQDSKKQDCEKDEIKQEYDAIKSPVTTARRLANQNFFARFKIYEPWYIIPAYYSITKPYSSKIQRVDFKAQISFRLELLNDVLCKFCAFSFDYTQKLYLQAYNSAESSPLRDTDLSPQLSFIYKKPIYIGGNGYINWLSIGYNHISNGEKEDVLPEDTRNTVRSKALDRIFIQANYRNGGFNARMRVWAIVGIFDGKYTNPDINDYIGYGDIKLSYQYHNNLFEITINNILNNYFNADYWNFKGNIELNYSYGITKNYALFVQYITGHGDSLYEYSLPVKRFGIGVRLRDF